MSSHIALAQESTYLYVGLYGSSILGQGSGIDRFFKNKFTPILAEG